jgi:hypothetical protein
MTVSFPPHIQSVGIWISSLDTAKSPAGGGPGDGGGLIIPFAKHDPPRLPTEDSFFSEQCKMLALFFAAFKFQAAQSGSGPHKSQHSSLDATIFIVYDAPKTQLPIATSVRHSGGSSDSADALPKMICKTKERMVTRK